jgi:molybdopterin converting factor small subunit
MVMAVKVFIPTPLRSYTHRASRVEAEGATLQELFSHLDRGYPGIRFRIVDEQDEIREHIRVFVNQERAFHLDAPLGPGDQVQIICAISGG